jgi:predicted  nucleic acid-binding Zn-ribbon protein
MAVAQKSGEEILVEQLSALVTSLRAEQKAKESAIRELNDQMKLAETALAMKFATVQAAFEKKKAELDAAILPLQALASQVDPLKAEIARLKTEKGEAVAAIRHAKGTEIQAADAQVAKARAKLFAIEMAMAACKAKVAAL